VNELLFKALKAIILNFSPFNFDGWGVGESYEIFEEKK
jgi:hypothetical protein